MNSLIFCSAVSMAVEKMKDLFSPSYQKEVESYLSESVDLSDLEHRVKLLQLRGFII